MHDVYIVGAGGYGRVVHSQLRDDVACGREWRIAGFLDDRTHILDGYACETRIVGDAFAYQPGANDRFVCAIGSVQDRARYTAPLLGRGADFISIRTEAYLGANVVLGAGCFLERRVTIGPDCRLGRFVNVHSLAILGHDVVIGDYSQISCFSFIGGHASIGSTVTIFPHAVILPGVRIGDGATIGAGSIVLKDVPAGVTVFGNPAKRVS